MKQKVQLEHVSCQNCVKHVTGHFLKIEGVSDVLVDLDSKTAQVTVDRPLSAEDYQVALAKTIYKVLQVENI